VNIRLGKLSEFGSPGNPEWPALPLIASKRYLHPFISASRGMIHSGYAHGVLRKSFS
jgi:hypothetical protein